MCVHDRILPVAERFSEPDEPRLSRRAEELLEEYRDVKKMLFFEEMPFYSAGSECEMRSYRETASAKLLKRLEEISVELSLLGYCL